MKVDKIITIYDRQFRLIVHSFSDLKTPLNSKLQLRLVSYKPQYIRVELFIRNNLIRLYLNDVETNPYQNRSLKEYKIIILNFLLEKCYQQIDGIE